MLIGYVVCVIRTMFPSVLQVNVKQQLLQLKQQLKPQLHLRLVVMMQESVIAWVCDNFTSLVFEKTI